MDPSLPKTMRAVAIDRFGGLDELKVRALPVPLPGPDQVLIRVEFAGVGVWDPYEREGGFAEMSGTRPSFPYVLGSEGAGTVAALGEGVDHLRVGDRVYASGFLNPRGGFYAEYVAIDAGLVSRIPANLTVEQAAVFSGDGLTALRGLDDVLGLKAGESLLVLGAGGGLGHLAVQLAKRMGARVLAVASRADGVDLCRRIGADAAVDGRADDVPAAARAFASGGLDAALLVAGGDVAEQALAALRDGGRAAYPNGVEPAPRPRPGVSVRSFDGDPDRAILAKLDRLVASGPFHVHVARAFPLDEVALAHRALDTHYLGKLALRIG